MCCNMLLLNSYDICKPSLIELLMPSVVWLIAGLVCLWRFAVICAVLLCSHVLCNKYGYLNERVILIGASGGLVLVDHVKGIDDIFSVNKHILILDKIDYVKQINDILDNYEEYIELRRNFNKVCHDKYTYNKWAKTIHDVLKNDNMV